MSAHSKNPYITPSLDFPLPKRGSTGPQGAATGICLDTPRGAAKANNPSASHVGVLKKSDSQMVRQSAHVADQLGARTATLPSGRHCQHLSIRTVRERQGPVAGKRGRGQ